MAYLNFILPLVFVVIWVSLTYIVANMGWKELSDKFKQEKPFEGKRIGIISAFINDASYHNGIILKFNHEGIFLKSILAFRLFHPAMFIPWTAVKEVNDKTQFLSNLKELIVGDPLVGVIRLKTKTFEKMKREYNNSKSLDK